MDLARNHRGYAIFDARPATWRLLWDLELVEPDGIEPTTSSMPLLWPHFAGAFLGFLFVENLLET
jgi:hypothetical protein